MHASPPLADRRILPPARHQPSATRPIPHVLTSPAPPLYIPPSSSVDSPQREQSRQDSSHQRSIHPHGARLRPLHLLPAEPGTLLLLHEAGAPRALHQSPDLPRAPAARPPPRHNPRRPRLGRRHRRPLHHLPFLGPRPPRRAPRRARRAPRPPGAPRRARHRRRHRLLGPPPGRPPGAGRRARRVPGDAGRPQAPRRRGPGRAAPPRRGAPRVGRPRAAPRREGPRPPRVVRARSRRRQLQAATASGHRRRGRGVRGARRGPGRRGVRVRGRVLRPRGRLVRRHCRRRRVCRLLQETGGDGDAHVLGHQERQIRRLRRGQGARRAGEDGAARRVHRRDGSRERRGVQEHPAH
uniref:Uncharacterized protein n=1 Tax=Zea mays TaxID=4577 RepID=A0A804PD33_MAIZE